MRPGRRKSHGAKVLKVLAGSNIWTSKKMAGPLLSLSYDLPDVPPATLRTVARYSWRCEAARARPRGKRIRLGLNRFNSMSLSAGDRLGPYEILQRIGKGGMGEVYRARDTRLGRDVAIKISAEQFDERFAR